MIYYSLLEISRGVLLSVLWGVALCALSALTDVFFSIAEDILRMPGRVINYSVSRKKAVEYLKSKYKPENTEKKGILFLKDFLFCVVSAVLISFLFYLASDGEIRVYLLIFMALAYAFCKKMIAIRVKFVVMIILRFVIKLVESVLIFIVLPLRFLFSKLIKLYKTCFGKIKFRKRERKHAKNRSVRKAIVQNSVKIGCSENKNARIFGKNRNI